MDWMYINPNDSGYSSSDLQLGIYVGDQFRISADADVKLINILDQLSDEDKVLRCYRRKLGSAQIVEKHLAAIMIESSSKNKFELFSTTIKLMTELTTPLECLFANVDMESTEQGANTLFELKQHLTDIKNVFLDPKISKSILSNMETILEKKQGSQEPMGFREKHMMTNSVTLIRNILHIPEDGQEGSDTSNTSESSPYCTSGEGNSAGSGDSAIRESESEENKQVNNRPRKQHQILWNLFAHNLDSVIMGLIESEHLKTWITPLVQLIALVYKDQHVNTLERLLNLWLESSLSESSEDNESNTTPQNHLQEDNGCYSSSLLTSTEPNSTDDASDGNGGASATHKSLDSDKGTCGSSGGVPSPDSPESFLETKIDEQDNIENIKIAVVPVPEVVKASVIQMDVEIRSEFSVDSSCTREPPRKKMAIEVSKSPMTNVKGSSDNDSGISGVKVTSNPEDPKCEVTSASEKPKSPTKSSNKNSSSETSSNSSLGAQEMMDTDCNVKNTAAKKDSSDDGYGYVPGQANLQPTSTEQQESNSTSSNDEDHRRNHTPHTNLQKPRPKKKKVVSAAEKRELRRKKLIERSKSKRLKVKALVNHVPSAEDMNDLLKEFTVDFLLKGYSSLATDLRLKLMSDDVDIDKSHFLWLITYFLKFASQLEVELEQIGPVLSVETVAYLTYEGVRFFEDLELALREQRERPVDLRPHLRRIHLVVTALREFFTTLEIYGKFSHFNQEDKDKLQNVHLAVCGMRELRQLFLLLIRKYDPSFQTKQYLTDLVCGNHSLLVMIENVKKDVEVMTSHLTQFASVEIMRQYGHLLEGFDTNPEFVNDCIFTMMHHVSGDLNHPETLFIPQVLETFSDIWEREDVEICVDWADLIEYVIQKFISTIRSRPHAYASHLLECLSNSEAADENGFTKSQLDHLYTFYTQVEDNQDAVGCVIELYKTTLNVTKTRLAVIQALLSQGIISLAQYMNMMYMKSLLAPCKNEGEGSVVVEVGSEHCDSEGHAAEPDMENAHEYPALHPNGNSQIEKLKELLKKQGKASLLSWLQQTLLDACCVKINGNDLFKPTGGSLEPVPFHFNYINQSIPMVAWSKGQESGLQTETFMLLLHQLGFHLATDVGKCFPRIPHFWSADHLYNLALKVAPVRKEELRIMDMSLLDISTDNDKAETNDKSFEDQNLLSPSGSSPEAATSSSTFDAFVIPSIPVSSVRKSSITSQSSLRRIVLSGSISDISEQGDGNSTILVERMEISEDGGDN